MRLVGGFKYTPFPPQFVLFLSPEIMGVRMHLVLLASSLLMPVMPTLHVLIVGAKEVPRMKAVPNRKNDGLLSPNNGQNVLPPTDLALSSNVKNAYCQDPGYCEHHTCLALFRQLTRPEFPYHSTVHVAYHANVYTCHNSGPISSTARHNRSLTLCRPMRKLSILLP